MERASQHDAGWMESDPFADLSVPEPLQESLRRHRDHLARLIVSLQSAGIDEAQIEASVSAVVASYKAELLEAIKTMVMNDRDRHHTV